VPESMKSISSCLRTYSVQTNELRQPKIGTHNTFHRYAAFHVVSPSILALSPILPSFGAALILAPRRQLHEDARSVQDLKKLPCVFFSAAHLFDLTKHFWVRGSHISIAALLGVASNRENAKQSENSRCVRARGLARQPTLTTNLAILRPVPANDHRFHSLFDGTVGAMVDILG
jgi:phosphatidylserine decarboxylase